MSAAPATQPAPAIAVEDRRFLGHPRGLSTLFFTEIWERFSYYGMRALLILFMTASAEAGGLGFDTARAGAIYGLYTSLVYLLSLPGGWIADRILGQRRAVLYGGVLIFSGHVCLAIHSLETFYAGLALIVLGTGLLKPNISVMVGQQYAEGDKRRDSGFSIFYMGINLGAFLAPLVCGWLAQDEGFRGFLESNGVSPARSWRFGFGMAAVGMALGLVQYVAGGRRLGEAGLRPAGSRSPEERAAAIRKLRFGLGGVVLLLAGLALAHGTGAVRLTVEGISRSFALFLALLVVGFFAWVFLSGSWSPAERTRLLVIAVLFAASAIFWAVFEQAGSTLNLFAQRNTETVLFGWRFPASWLQSVNGALIVLLAPVFAWLWFRLGPRDPSSPAKFALGLLFAGLGFALLVGPASASGSGDDVARRVGPLWLVGTYLFHTMGELCLSPVGLSAMTRLAPERVGGLMMGAWFLSLSVGNYAGGRVASRFEAFPLPGIFATVGGAAIAAAVLLSLFVRPIGRLLGAAK
ncbi:MAG: peptide MFS transporter [Planctomycetes bacterium]|nr:peptide MFS transporter [Planctomycetota bacterium]